MQNLEERIKLELRSIGLLDDAAVRIFFTQCIAKPNIVRANAVIAAV
jgi:hypothetical protein